MYRVCLYRWQSSTAKNPLSFSQYSLLPLGAVAATELSKVKRQTPLYSYHTAIVKNRNEKGCPVWLLCQSWGSRYVLIHPPSQTPFWLFVLYRKGICPPLASASLEMNHKFCYDPIYRSNDKSYGNLHIFNLGI